MKMEKIKTFSTPDDYILNQPEERQKVLRKLRQVINSGLPKGFAETIQYNMISYVVPHGLYPGGYHVNPKEPSGCVNSLNCWKNFARQGVRSFK